MKIILFTALFLGVSGLIIGAANEKKTTILTRESIINFSRAKRTGNRSPAQRRCCYPSDQNNHVAYGGRCVPAPAPYCVENPCPEGTDDCNGSIDH